MDKNEFVSRKLKFIQHELEEVIKEGRNLQVKDFENQIIDVFNKEFERDSEPRYTLMCLIRKTIHENLILIIIVGVFMLALVLGISQCVMN